MFKMRSHRSLGLAAKDPMLKKGVRRWKSSMPFSFESVTEFGKRSTKEAVQKETTNLSSQRSNLPAYTNSTIATSISHVRHFASAATGAPISSTNTDSTAKNLEDDGYGLNRNNDSMSWLQRFQQPPDPGTLILVRHGIFLF
jgi:hypothetical protein